ncbi:GAF and ANTAR domain-containing protein [Mycolicibacterium mengxianglii]|uniref:GAF and ANTAR domain-containing protein n=1 Tax=Mycolicibacterium mengxianglii TaxID=2736649 RepID=UPI0018D1690A|nr:GAF and ANTAR domain-containing protein [Mycolicibacterium mengxianglii]
MDHGDPRTDNSVVAAAAGDASAGEAADVVIAGAVQDKLSPTMLGQMLVTAGRSINDEDDLLTLLQRVAEIAHEVIKGADSTGVTIDFGGRTYTAVHTDRRTLRVDSEQYDADDGPCLEAARTGTVVRVDSADAAERWPRFAAAAAAEGIHSFLAAPLHAAGQPLGSFNLYGHTRSAFDSVDAEILDLLTATVSRTIADFARFKSARDVAESIQRALTNRGPIEQAKGMLMLIHGIDADEAFDRLRTQSQNTNIPLRTVATTFIERTVGTTTPR